MKVRVASLFVLLVTGILPACDETEQVLPAPEPVDKTVVFHIFGGQNFSYSRYGEEMVTIQLIINRKDKGAASGMETAVFDSTFTMPLKDIPVRENRLVIKKLVPGVLDEKENVFMSSGYHYMQTSFGKNQTFPADQVENTVQLTVY